MAQHGRPAKPVEPEAGILSTLGETLERFSRELAKRYPDRYIKRFVMPTSIRQAREVFILEVDGKEELQAAAMADNTMSDKEKASQQLTRNAEQREVLRISIVGVGRDVDGAVAYEHTNGATPFMEMNTWPSKAFTCLNTYFGEVNGVSTSELLRGIVGAHPVGAHAALPKIVETKESDESEK